MTDLFMDGYDHYGVDGASVTAMGSGPYSSIINVAVTGHPYTTYCGAPSWGSAATGPYCLVSGWGVQSSLKAYAALKSVPSASTTIYMSLRFAMDALPANNYSTWIADFRNGSGTVMGTLAVTTTGAIELRDVSNNLIATTAAGVLTARTFAFIEMCWDQTTTKFTLRVNDTYATITPAITVTNAAVGTVNNIGLLPQYNTHSIDAAAPGGIYLDDLYIRNATGTVNSSWLGSRRITWLPATNLAASSYTTPTVVKFSTGPLPANTIRVSAVQLVQGLYTNSGTSAEQGTFIAPFGATTVGGAHTVTTTPTIFSDLLSVDPDTTIGLTPSSITNNSVSISLG